MTRTARIATIALGLALLPVPALAHVGIGGVHTFTAGLAHPFNGLDHLLAAFAVGFWAMLSGARRPLILPLTFMTAMGLATVAGAGGMRLLFVEPAIASSVVVLGLLLALAVRAPTWVGAIIVAVFALVHGHAHGAEGGAAFAYLAGLLTATGALHLAGAGVGFLSLAAGRPVLARAAGIAIALGGVWLLAA